MNFIASLLTNAFMPDTQQTTAIEPIEPKIELTPTQKFNIKLQKARETYEEKLQAQKDINSELLSTIEALKMEVETKSIALHMKAYRDVVAHAEQEAINHNVNRTTIDNFGYLKTGTLEYILGHKEGSNALIVGNISDDAQLLISGRTGSGKTVTTLNVLASITAINTPSSLKISLIDPKILTFGDDRVENSPFLNEKPAIGDEKQALKILNDAFNGMMKRYHLMRKHGVKDYRKIGLPAHVIFIDEIFELLEGANAKEILSLLTRIASLGRAGGVHLVLATQSPRAKTLSGTLKANLCFIGHKMSNSTESNLIGLKDAHELRGKGDGLREINGEIVRFQATFFDENNDKSYSSLNPIMAQSTVEVKQPQNAPVLAQNDKVNTIEQVAEDKAFKALLRDVVSTIDEKGKVKPKSYFISVKKREELKRWNRAMTVLHKEDQILSYRNGIGYFLDIDLSIALNIIEEK